MTLLEIVALVDIVAILVGAVYVVAKMRTDAALNRQALGYVADAVSELKDVVKQQNEWLEDHEIRLTKGEL